MLPYKRISFGLDAMELRGAAETGFAALVSLNLTGQLPDVPAASRELARRLTGLGVLQPLLDDPADLVQELIVRQGYVQVERAGAIQDAGNLAPDAEFGHIVVGPGNRADAEADALA